jgi:hypothetical protein
VTGQMEYTMSLPRRFSAALVIIPMLLTPVVALPGSASANTKPGVITVTYQGCGPPGVKGTALARPALVYLKTSNKTVADHRLKKYDVPYRFVTNPGRYQIEGKDIATLDVVLRSGKVLKENVSCSQPVG